MTAAPRTWSGDLVEVAHRVARNTVYWTRCAVVQTVNGAECLEKGWPRHCKATMSIDTPEERRKST